MILASTGQVSVASTAGGTKIIDVTSLTDATNRRAVVIKNTSASLPVWIGASGLTTGTGHQLGAGESVSIPATNPIYGIVTSTAVTVTYAELTDH